MSNVSTKLLFILTLFISGFCGISYEILYSRLLGNIVGNHFVLNASILVMFLLGIGIGTKIAHRFTGFLWAIEGLIGIYAISFTFFYDFLDALFFKILPNNMYVTTGTCALLLAIPTVLIGISLPLFAGLFKEISKSEKIFDFSYTIYNLGACITAFMIEFYLIRAFGIKNSVLVIASLNLFSAASLFIFFRHIKIDLKEEESFIYEKRILLPLILLSISSAIFQLLILKVSEFVFGPFNETFAMVISLTLLGIAVGSLMTHYTKLNFTFFALTNIISIIFVLSLFDQIVLAYATYNAYFTGSSIIYFKMFVLAILMLWSAIGFGSGIPSLLDKESNVAKESGHLLFVSSLANSFGYLIMLIFIHPNLKYGQTFILITFLLGLAIIIYNKFDKAIIGVVVVANAFGVISLNNVWNENLLYINYSSFSSRSEFLNNMYSYKSGTQYRKYEDVFSLNKIGDAVFFMINGYVSMALNMAAEYTVGVVSSIVAPRTNDALVLGLGSGSTGSTVTQIFDHTDIVEINPIVIEHEHEMKEYNFDIVNDKRANIICDDGIRYMKNTDKKYDLVLNTVTSALYFRSSKLYTTDFFKVVKTKLRDDGIYVTWIDSRIGQDGLNIVLKSLQSEFKYSWSALIKSSYFVLVNSNKPLKLRQEDKIANNKVLKDFFMSKHARTIEDLRYLFVLDDSYKTLKYTKAEDTPLNTLDYPVLEFAISKLDKDRSIGEFRAMIRENYTFDKINKSIFNTKPIDPIALVKAHNQVDTTSSFTKFFTRIAKKENVQFDYLLKKSMLSDVEQGVLKYNNPEIFDKAWFWYQHFGESNKASTILEKQIKKYPKYEDGLYKYAKSLYYKKNLKDSEKTFKKLAEINPSYSDAYYWLGKIYFDQAKEKLSEEMFYKCIETDGSQKEAYFWLGKINYLKDDYKKAISLFHQAYELDPEDPYFSYWLAKSYYLLKENDKSELFVKRGLKNNPIEKDRDLNNKLITLLKKIIQKNDKY